MKPHPFLVIAAVASLAAGPAQSQDCASRIADLEARLEEAAKASISTSSGGQGVAGAREAEAMQEEEFKDDPPDGSASEGEGVTPFQEEGREAEAVERADEAGEGGERVLEARALLEEAKVHSGDGDVSACDDAVQRATLLLEED